MRDIFSKMPATMTRQILLRSGITLLTFILFVTVTAIFNNIYLYMPCLILFAVMIVNTFALVYNCVKGNYVILEGLCSDVEITKIKRKIKAIELKAQDRVFRFPINKRIGKINLGDTVIVYLSDKTLLYEKDGIFIIYEYYALEVKERNYEFTKRKID